ncbi:MAG TPA: hypothetical protein DEA55_01630 [Rhodospirillaceae bacterium]|nr:hypothetical protein [Rhodospirillaceae bacterium]
MRYILLISLSLIALGGTAQAGTIKASVNGLVCAFCATGIEKTFMKQSEVEAVIVDLEKKLVTITTKDGQDMDDETITRLITDSGYAVTDIAREQENESTK